MKITKPKLPRRKPKAPPKPHPKVCGRPPKLTKDQVLAIHEWDAMRKALPDIKQIAGAYGIHRSTIIRLLAGDYARYVT